MIAASVSAVNGINALMNAESLMGFELKDPASFLKLVPKNLACKMFAVNSMFACLHGNSIAWAVPPRVILYT